MNQSFDVIIVTTASDYLRVKGNINRILKLVKADKFIFVGSKQVGDLVAGDNFGTNVDFVDENSIIPFDDVHLIVKSILGREDVPRGVTGWYYQQFLKMKYSYVTDKDYYMSWDGDTVPCKLFDMFDPVTGKPYFDVKSEYHEEYFNTITRLFPEMHKVIGKSFISEHMIFNKTIMHELIREIEGNTDIPGTSFFEKILRAIRPGELLNNGYSEFETFGTYVAFRHSEAYRIRRWHSIRYGSMYFIPEEMTEDDYEWIGVDFDAVSFEKNQDFTPELAKYFNAPEYRTKLSARYIVETIQECSPEGMKEIWD